MGASATNPILLSPHRAARPQGEEGQLRAAEDADWQDGRPDSTADVEARASRLVPTGRVAAAAGREPEGRQERHPNLSPVGVSREGSGQPPATWSKLAGEWKSPTTKAPSGIPSPARSASGEPLMASSSPATQRPALTSCASSSRISERYGSCAGVHRTRWLGSGQPLRFGLCRAIRQGLVAAVGESSGSARLWPAVVRSPLVEALASVRRREIGAPGGDTRPDTSEPYPEAGAGRCPTVRPPFLRVDCADWSAATSESR